MAFWRTPTWQLYFSFGNDPRSSHLQREYRIGEPHGGHLSSHIQHSETFLAGGEWLFKRFYIFRQRYTSLLPKAANGRPFVSTFHEVSCEKLKNWTSFWDRKFRENLQKLILNFSASSACVTAAATDVLLPINTLGSWEREKYNFWTALRDRKFKKDTQS